MTTPTNDDDRYERAVLAVLDYVNEKPTPKGGYITVDADKIRRLIENEINPKSLYDIAIETFEAAFEGEGKTLSAALDHALVALADRIEKCAYEIEHRATTRALLLEISESLRPSE